MQGGEGLRLESKLQKEKSPNLVSGLSSKSF